VAQLAAGAAVAGAERVLVETHAHLQQRQILLLRGDKLAREQA